MRFEMKMPDLATTESEIRIVRWIVEPGQKAERGQPLLEVETDKASMEVESVVSGVLAEVLAPVNEAVSVGQAIAVLEVAEARSGGAAGPSQGPPTPHAEREVYSSSVAPHAEREEYGSVSGRTPHAPREAQPRQEGAAGDEREVSRLPVGAAGGMFARNRAAASATTPATHSAAIPLSVAQRVAAKRLHESKQTIPHFYLQTSVNASAIVARRKAAAPVKLAWDAFIVLAVAKAIGKFDRFRCRLDGERLTPIESDAIGVAVDRDNELYVVPVGSPATKTVEQISAEIRQSVERLRSGDPEMRKIRPALLTVTNLGVCNVEAFIPIINPPEAAVLGVGRVMPTPVAHDDGWIGVQQRCTLTLSVDHRITSGKYAGDFLAAIARELESM